MADQAGQPAMAITAAGDVPVEGLVQLHPGRATIESSRGLEAPLLASLAYERRRQESATTLGGRSLSSAGSDADLGHAPQMDTLSMYHSNSLTRVRRLLVSFYLILVTAMAICAWLDVFLQVFYHSIQPQSKPRWYNMLALIAIILTSVLFTTYLVLNSLKLLRSSWLGYELVEVRFYFQLRAGYVQQTDWSVVLPSLVLVLLEVAPLVASMAMHGDQDGIVAFLTLWMSTATLSWGTVVALFTMLELGRLGKSLLYWAGYAVRGMWCRACCCSRPACLACDGRPFARCCCCLLRPRVIPVEDSSIGFNTASGKHHTVTQATQPWHYAAGQHFTCQPRKLAHTLRRGSCILRLQIAAVAAVYSAMFGLIIWVVAALFLNKAGIITRVAMGIMMVIVAFGASAEFARYCSCMHTGASLTVLYHVRLAVALIAAAGIAGTAFASQHFAAKFAAAGTGALTMCFWISMPDAAPARLGSRWHQLVRSASKDLPLMTFLWLVATLSLAASWAACDTGDCKGAGLTLLFFLALTAVFIARACQLLLVPQATTAGNKAKLTRSLFQVTMGVFVALGLVLVTVGLLVPHTGVSPSVAVTTGNATQPAELSYEFCRLKRHGLSIVDMALMAQLSYEQREDAARDLNTWFNAPGMPAPTYGDWRLVPTNTSALHILHSDQLDLNVVPVRSLQLGTHWQLDADIWGESLLTQAIMGLTPAGLLLTPPLVQGWVQLLQYFNDLISATGLSAPYVQHLNTITGVQLPPAGATAFVGHSLGGGLAKLAAAKQLQASTKGVFIAVSFSGPGLTYTGPTAFGVTTNALDGVAISVQPQYDILPMVDEQRGLVQHICCSKSSSSCHLLGRTIVNLLARCGDPFGRSLTNAAEFSSQC